VIETTIIVTPTARYCLDQLENGAAFVTRFSEVPLQGAEDLVLVNEPLVDWAPPVPGNHWHFRTVDHGGFITRTVREVITS
jgi:hypothetical protein